MNGMGDHAPYVEVRFSGYFNGWVCAVVGFEQQLPIAQPDAFDRQLAIKCSYDDVAIARLNGSVYDYQVAIKNSSGHHRIATDAQKKRSDGVRDKMLVKIKQGLDIVVGWGWKPRLHSRDIQRQPSRWANLTGLDVMYQLHW